MTLTAAELNTLHAFATGWADTYDGMTQFAHLAALALDGEEFAMERIATSANARGALAIMHNVQGNDALLTDTDCEEIARLLVLVDTSRPDGSITRKLDWV